jgi:PAS domain S-box-containing protein
MEDKQAELFESEKRFRSLIQNIPDVTWTINGAGRTLFVSENANWELGFNPQEICDQEGSFWLEHVHPEDTERVKKAYDDLFENNVAFNQEYRMSNKNGDWIWVYNRAIQTYQSDDTKWTSGLLTNISAKKQSELALKNQEDQMRQAQKMDAIGRLAGGVAHDYNNLLSVIGGNVEFLLEGLKLDSSQKEVLQDVQTAVRQGAELTKQLLVFGQKQVSKPEAVDLNAVSTEMNKMFKRLIDATIDLSIIQDKALKPIQADPGQIQQVILNLVLNARDAMPKGGSLTLETKNVMVDESEQGMNDYLPPGTYAQLNVTDTGTGMTAEVQNRIFEPFFTTKADKGTGLGLASVYGIVKKWNGYIFVRSVLGVGSNFSISFPTFEMAEMLKTTPKQEPLIPMGSETILVAEDEELVRKVLVRALQRHGYKVLQATNGVEALQKASEHYGEIDLLLTDTIMPEMNGKELADQLKKSRPEVKVIFISGYTEEILSQRGIINSSVNLIEKPFESDHLVRRVRKVLDDK